jgi:nicotinate-nucleotide adenylyltransferase
MSEPAARAPVRVAFFGGSFNPPHVAHLLAAVYALSVAPVDQVLVVPVYKHPFAKELAPFEERLAMCELAMGWIPRVTVSSVERDLGGESLTLRTLRHLAAAHPEWRMRLLVGSDVLPDLGKWHRFDEIAKIAAPLVLPRAGASSEDPVLPEVSSTRVRELFSAAASGDGAGHAELAKLVPRSVLEHALARGLYGPSRRSSA